MKKPDLAALVARYQAALRLRDWRISVSYQRDLVDSKGRAVWALSLPTVDAKVATIIFRDPATPPTGETAESASAQVVETVVHELVRLHFAAFQNVAPTAKGAEDQAVLALAEALVKAESPADRVHFARAVNREMAAPSGIAPRSRSRLLAEIGAALGVAIGASERDIERHLFRMAPSGVPARTIQTEYGPVTLSPRERVEIASHTHATEEGVAHFKALEARERG